jgi:Ca2+-binding EF-hand superfamily protein
MSLSRKHFREIARILGQNFANDDLINEFVSFCASQNSYFQKQTFLNAIEDNKKIVEDAQAKCSPLPLFPKNQKPFSLIN